MNLIEKLKKNYAKFSWLPHEEQETFNIVGKENCERLVESGEWHSYSMDVAGDKFIKENRYRIKSDYQPEPEIEKCHLDPSDSGRLVFHYKGKNYFLHEAQSFGKIFAGLEAEDGSIRLGLLADLQPDGTYKNIPPKYVLMRQSWR